MTFDTTTIPAELWESYIFKYLDIRDLCVVRAVCHNLNLLVNHFDGHSMIDVAVKSVKQQTYIEQHLPRARLYIGYRKKVQNNGINNNSESPYIQVSHEDLLVALSKFRFSELIITYETIIESDLTNIDIQDGVLHLINSSLIHILDNTIPTLSGLVVGRCTQLTTISNFSNLLYLHIDSCYDIKCIYPLPKLHTLLLYDTYMIPFGNSSTSPIMTLPHLPSLQRLCLKNTLVTEIKDIPTLTYLEIVTYRDDHIPISECPNIKHLEICKKNINYPELALPHLITLSIAGGDYQCISSLLRAESLESIKLHSTSNTAVEHIPEISNLPNLHTLSIRNGNVHTISNNPRLENLKICESKIHAISDLPRLSDLFIGGSNIEYIALNIAPDHIIKSMEIYGNTIDYIYFCELTRVKVLKWEKNRGGKHDLLNLNVTGGYIRDDPHECISREPTISKDISYSNTSPPIISRALVQLYWQIAKHNIKQWLRL